MLRLSNQPNQRPLKPQHELAKSTSVSSVLYGVQNDSKSHFIDSLERFQKDYATHDKGQRARQREKRMKILEERKNQQIERQSRMRRNQMQYDQIKMDKINNSRYLCEIGVRKTGFTNGLPMNPITLQYHHNQNGNQQQYLDEEHKLKGMVRAHHIQNASTSGYNPINGSNLPSIAPLIPKNTEGRFEEKVCQFYQTKKLDPNCDLHLNPKKVLPRHVGQVDRGNSPIKRQIWQDEDAPFQSSYKSQFNQRPHQQMVNSRMQQSQEIQEKIMKHSKISNTQPPQKYQQQQPKQQYVNNENINPYMQDSAYNSQIYQNKGLSRGSQHQKGGQYQDPYHHQGQYQILQQQYQQEPQQNQQQYQGEYQEQMSQSRNQYSAPHQGQYQGNYQGQYQ